MSAESDLCISFCRELAIWLHRNDKDKQGQPLFYHCERVAMAFGSPEDWELRCAGYLHDSVEDGCISIRTLAELGIPKRILDLVFAVTRYQETYTAYILRIAANQDARRIKLADLADNLDESRGPIPESLLARYQEARALLLAGGAFQAGEQPGHRRH